MRQVASPACMAQAGRLVICASGDAGDALERFLVRGGDLRARQGSLAGSTMRGSEPMSSTDRRRGQEPAGRRGFDHYYDPGEFRRVASAKELVSLACRCQSGVLSHERGAAPRRYPPAGWRGPRRPARRIRRLRPGDHRLHPAGGRHRPLRNPRPRREAARAELRRDLLFLAAFAVALSAVRRIPRALRDQNVARHALRLQAHRARDSHYHRRHELRRPVRAGERSSRPGRHGAGDLLPRRATVG